MEQVISNPFDVILKRLEHLEDKIDTLSSAEMVHVTPDDGPIGVDQCREHCKWKSNQTVYRYVRTDPRFPWHKKGNRLYFFRSELNEFLKAYAS